MATVRTRGFPGMLDRNVARPGPLHHPTQPLTDLVCGRFNLIIVRRSAPLLQLLQPTRHLRRPLQKFRQLRLQCHPLRVHANLLGRTPNCLTTASLTYFHAFHLLTFSETKIANNP
jgi:hypothetical protein